MKNLCRYIIADDASNWSLLASLTNSIVKAYNSQSHLRSSASLTPNIKVQKTNVKKSTVCLWWRYTPFFRKHQVHIEANKLINVKIKSIFTIPWIAKNYWKIYLYIFPILRTIICWDFKKFKLLYNTFFNGKIWIFYNYLIYYWESHLFVKRTFRKQSLHFPRNLSNCLRELDHEKLPKILIRK